MVAIDILQKTPQELARQIWDHISAHPEEHDQRWWKANHDLHLAPERCGTTRCIAGWAVYFTQGCDTVMTVYGYLKDGSKLLGLSIYDAHLLFLHTDDRQAVEALECVVKGDTIDWVAIGVPAKRHYCALCKLSDCGTNPLWSNGMTSDFGSENSGSNPGKGT